MTSLYIISLEATGGLPAPAGEIQTMRMGFHESRGFAAPAGFKRSSESAEH